MSYKRRVLVVDDDKANREVVCEILVSAGFCAISAETATAALGILNSEKFDAVITDHSMPEMKGAELAGLLRTRYPDMLIIGMSGDDSRGIFLEAGVELFLPKPLDFYKLVSLVGSDA